MTEAQKAAMRVVQNQLYRTWVDMDFEETPEAEQALANIDEATFKAEVAAAVAKALNALD